MADQRQLAAELLRGLDPDPAFARYRATAG
jgi:hypothetical protein